VSTRFSFFMIAPCNACACFLDTSITISSPLSRSKNPIAKRCFGTADLMSFDSYGIYKKVNSFVAENPSKKSKAGNPVDNLTPWDKAWKYYADKSEQFGDEASTEAYKYKPKQRFAMGFFDLDISDTSNPA